MKTNARLYLSYHRIKMDTGYKPTILSLSDAASKAEEAMHYIEYKIS